jgi:hypothetical protein
MTQTIEEEIESQELSQQIQNELDDAMRLEITKVLRQKIEQNIKTQNQKLKATGQKVVVYTKRTIDDSEEIKLLRISHRILQENSIPNGLDIVEKGQTLLYMLSSRSKRNIAQSDLDFIEKSGSLDDFQGFFKDPNAKNIFD